MFSERSGAGAAVLATCWVSLLSSTGFTAWLLCGIDESAADKEVTVSTCLAPTMRSASAMRGWWVKYSKDSKNRENCGGI